ncbi:type II secretion system protein GspC [Corallococcus sp. BB11-1]|uniref:type II secretion system protein GspC n=1 Tax=Corallococcus sp. BB11-1 TaxID=2996783 RepID=UPI002D1E4AEE|nr:type II secretion system protein GspC [Corallococcus sp. BB11-1]
MRRSVQGGFALLLSSCALTTALIVNQVFGGLLMTTIQDRDLTAPARLSMSSGPLLDAPLLARLTGVSLPEEDSPPPGKVEPTGPEIPRSTLPLRLLGTLVAQDPRWSMASIQELSGSVARSLMVSDALPGARVFAIERERILLVVDGRLEYIDGASLPGATPTPVNIHAGAATPGSSTLGKGIRATGEHSLVIPREDVTEALTHLNELAMEARVVPAFKEGRPVGFKLFSIKDGSLYSRLGMRNGDVLQRINGLNLDGPDKALEAFTRLRDARRIELQIERGGAPVQKTFDVQ